MLKKTVLLLLISLMGIANSSYAELIPLPTCNKNDNIWVAPAGWEIIYKKKIPCNGIEINPNLLNAGVKISDKSSFMVAYFPIINAKKGGPSVVGITTENYIQDTSTSSQWKLQKMQKDNNLYVCPSDDGDHYTWPTHCPIRKKN
ncbi:hypothetical protein BH10PSE19_BH10PSE19_05210 [soil metagenome]